MAGALRVDKIRRHEASRVLNVDIRLRNTTDKTVEGSYFIEFRSPTHQTIMGQKKGYQAFQIEPFGYTVVNNSALATGAIGFRLFLRTASLEDNGYADPKE